MRFNHFTDATAYQWGAISRNGAPWSGRSGSRSSRRRSGSREADLFTSASGSERSKLRSVAGLGEDGPEVVGPAVGALEENLDPFGRRLGSVQDVAEESSGPACGRDRVCAPRFSRRQWSGVEPPVSCALERDGPVHCRSSPGGRSGEGDRVRDCAADFEVAVVDGDGEVAPDVVEPGGCDVAGERFRWCFGVKGAGLINCSAARWSSRFCVSAMGSLRAVGCGCGVIRSRSLGRSGPGLR